MQAHELSSDKISTTHSEQHNAYAAQQAVVVQPYNLASEPVAYCQQAAHMQAHDMSSETVSPTHSEQHDANAAQQVVFIQPHNFASEEQMVHIPSNQQVGFLPAQDLSNQACTGFWVCPVQPAAQAFAGFVPAWQVYPQAQYQIAGAQCDNMWGAAQMPQPQCQIAGAQYDNTQGAPQMFCVDPLNYMYGQAVVQMPTEEALVIQQAAMVDAPVQAERYASLQGQIWRLSTDYNGCRRVQEAFSAAVSDDERRAFASELRGHVWEAMKCPNANHVLQKFIDELRPVDSQFVIDEIQLGGIGAALRVARHRYGCRILQRLLEHSSSAPGRVHDLMEEILSDGVQLATHIYANYVLSHLLEFGTESQKCRLTNLLAAHAASVGANCYGCAVLRNALDHGSSEARVVLAHALLVQPHLLTAMACSRHGHGAVKQALEVADMPQRKMALSALMQQRDWKNCRYGRALYNHLEKCWEQEQSA